MTRFDCSGISTDSLDSCGQLDAAADYFIKEGYAILDNVLPGETVEALNREFLSDYAPFLEDVETEQSLSVGGRRWMVSMRFAGGFADPLVFANPYIVALIRKLLEPTAILEAYGCFISLPNAPAQKGHFDGPHLFGTRLAAMLPPYALTVGIPLVEMNERQGTTSLQPGSHRWHEVRPDAPYIEPRVPIGSCMMWDYRLRHFGTENTLPTPRPLLYCTFSRPWYRDPVNFKDKPRMPRLACDPAFLAGLTEETRHLLGQFS
jgi:ectoine hydroxylase-related dioxygenase (phytanoyl-CoA dioxygenase family)